MNSQEERGKTKRLSSSFAQKESAPDKGSDSDTGAKILIPALETVSLFFYNDVLKLFHLLKCKCFGSLRKNDIHWQACKVKFMAE